MVNVTRSAGVWVNSGIWEDEPSRPSAGRRVMVEKHDQARAIMALTAGMQVVYALRLTDGTIKIGCTSNLAKRRNHYVGCEVLGFRPGDFEDEAEIHRTLKPHRARGFEYYHPTAEVIAAVNALRDHFGLPHIAA